jgi:SAM-dependent methyltransferase
MGIAAKTCVVCSHVGTPMAVVRVQDKFFGDGRAFEIQICESCGSGWLPELYSDDSQVDHYPETSYYSYRPSNDLGLAQQIRRVLVSRQLDSDLQVQNKLARFLGRVLPINMVKGIPYRTGRLLDVGCGSGTTVKDFVNTGIEVWGVDISRRALQLAQAQGIHTVLGDFSEVDLPEDYFDTVRMWHSLEHLRSPTEALLKARRILKDGGLLLIGTPDISSFYAKLFGRNWYHLDPPRHTVLFSQKGLVHASKNAGFDVISVSHWSDRGFFGSLLVSSSFLWGEGSRMRSFIDSSALALAEWPINLLTSHMGRGDHMELRCRKAPLSQGM